MYYVMSDIHGDYDKYMRMLKRINFSDDDTLYVLGDVIDRGDDGLRILQDMMMRVNVIPLIGNHEYMAAEALPWLLEEITDQTIAGFSEERMRALSEWMTVGGDTTVRAFGKLTRDEREGILDYLDEFSLFEEVEVKGKKFVLVHAGLKNFSPERDLEDYDLSELVFETPDFTKQYFSDRILVTGHLPTREIRKRMGISADENTRDTVFGKNRILGIDCGCGYGGKLACVCLDTLRAFYI